MDAGERKRLIGRLRELIARGATLAGAATSIGRSKSSASRLAKQAGLRPNGKLPAEKDRKIGRLLTRQRSIRSIAKTVNVSTATVHRRKLRREGDGPKSCRPWRCPIGGELLIVDRCIAHGAERKPHGAPRKRN